jgi:hypothetical protein
MRKEHYRDQERVEVAQAHENCHHRVDQQTPLRSQNLLDFSRKPSNEPGTIPRE